MTTPPPPQAFANHDFSGGVGSDGRHNQLYTALIAMFILEEDEGEDPTVTIDGVPAEYHGVVRTGADTLGHLTYTDRPALSVHVFSYFTPEPHYWGGFPSPVIEYTVPGATPEVNAKLYFGSATVDPEVLATPGPGGAPGLRAAVTEIVGTSGIASSSITVGTLSGGADLAFRHAHFLGVSPTDPHRNDLMYLVRTDGYSGAISNCKYHRTPYPEGDPDYDPPPSGWQQYAFSDSVGWSGATRAGLGPPGGGLMQGGGFGTNWFRHKFTVTARQMEQVSEVFLSFTALHNVEGIWINDTYISGTTISGMNHGVTTVAVDPSLIVIGNNIIASQITGALGGLIAEYIDYLLFTPGGFGALSPYLGAFWGDPANGTTGGAITLAWANFAHGLQYLATDAGPSGWRALDFVEGPTPHWGWNFINGAGAGPDGSAKVQVTGFALLLRKKFSLSAANISQITALTLKLTTTGDLVGAWINEAFISGSDVTGVANSTITLTFGPSMLQVGDNILAVHFMAPSGTPPGSTAGVSLTATGTWSATSPYYVAVLPNQIGVGSIDPFTVLVPPWPQVFQPGAGLEEAGTGNLPSFSIEPYGRTDGSFWSNHNFAEGSNQYYLLDSALRWKPALVDWLSVLVGVDVVEYVLPPRTAGWYSWGYNYSGSLGNGRPANRNALHEPREMLLPPEVTDISIGFQAGLGLITSEIPGSPPIPIGSLIGWGDNTSGGVGLPNLGPPSQNNWRSTPALVPGIVNVVQFGCADSWSAALKSDGTLWFTGRNLDGQFGNGSIAPFGSNVFGFTQTISGLPAIISRLRVHDNICSLIDASGQLWMAGRRSDHRMPDNNPTTSPLRNAVFTLMTDVTSFVRDVKVGAKAGIALYNDGTVAVWGDLGRGRTGDGNNYSEPHYAYVPVLVPGLTGITAIAASYETFFALHSSGTLYGWGQQSYQEAGFSGVDSDEGDPILVPTAFPLPPDVTARFIGHLTPYNETTLLCGSDGLMYGAGVNDGEDAGLICRLAEQPPGTTTWVSVPSGPTHGYVDFDVLAIPVVGEPDALVPGQLQVVAIAGVSSTFALWTGQIPVPPAAVKRAYARIVG